MSVPTDPFVSFESLYAYHSLLQIIGTIGSLIYVGGFLLVQSGRMDGNSVSYSSSKLIAAICVLASLLTAFNLASFLIQISFIAIALYGIWYRLSGRISAQLDRSSAAAVSIPVMSHVAHRTGPADNDARYAAPATLYRHPTRMPGIAVCHSQLAAADDTEASLPRRESQ